MLRIIPLILLLTAFNSYATPPGVIAQFDAAFGIKPREWVITNRGATRIDIPKTMVCR